MSTTITRFPRVFVVFLTLSSASCLWAQTSTDSCLNYGHSLSYPGTLDVGKFLGEGVIKSFENDCPRIVEVTMFQSGCFNEGANLAHIYYNDEFAIGLFYCELCSWNNELFTYLVSAIDLDEVALILGLRSKCVERSVAVENPDLNKYYEILNYGINGEVFEECYLIESESLRNFFNKYLK